MTEIRMWCTLRIPVPAGTLILSMQSLLFRPRTHCKVPLIFRAVALPAKSIHFCSSASDSTHQATEANFPREEQTHFTYSCVLVTPQTFKHHLTEEETSESEDIPVDFVVKTQRTDTRGRKRRKTTGSRFSERSMAALEGNLPGTISLIQHRWGAGEFLWKKGTLLPLPSHITWCWDGEGGRRGEREGKRWENQAGRLDVDRGAHYIIPLCPPSLVKVLSR